MFTVKKSKRRLALYGPIMGMVVSGVFRDGWTLEVCRMRNSPPAQGVRFIECCPILSAYARAALDSNK